MVPEPRERHCSDRKDISERNLDATAPCTAKGANMHIYDMVSDGDAYES